MARLFGVWLGGLVAALLVPSAGAQTPADLQGRAQAYYAWRDSISPVASSDMGKHRWDDRLRDFRMEKVRGARRHISALLDSVKAMPVSKWSTKASALRLASSRVPRRTRASISSASAS